MTDKSIDFSIVGESNLTKSNAHEWQIRKCHHEEQLNQADCLNLSTNEAIVWNMVQMWEVLMQMRREGHSIEQEAVKHHSPTRHERVNIIGKSSFPVQKELSRKTLRPLRLPRKDEYATRRRLSD